jgi:hypothetical protein
VHHLALELKTHQASRTIGGATRARRNISRDVDASSGRLP